MIKNKEEAECFFFYYAYYFRRHNGPKRFDPPRGAVVLGAPGESKPPGVFGSFSAEKEQKLCFFAKEELCFFPKEKASAFLKKFYKSVL